MSVKINVGYHPHNVIWKIDSTKKTRRHESNVFVLENADWRLRLDIALNMQRTEENWKMFLRKLHPKESCQSFVISVYVEDSNKKLQCLTTMRLVFAQLGEDMLMWRLKSDIESRHPGVVLEGTITFVIMFLPDHNFDSELENYTGK